MQSTQSATGLPPALALRQLIFGHRLTKLILTAVELGLADHLAAGPQTSTQLARLAQASLAAGMGVLRICRATWSAELRCQRLGVEPSIRRVQVPP